MSPLEPAATAALVAASPLAADYAASVDRESAYELLLARVAPEPAQAEAPAPQEVSYEEPEREGAVAAVLGSSVFRSFARSAASAAGREISRSLFGTAPRRRRTTRRR